MSFIQNYTETLNDRKGNFIMQSVQLLKQKGETMYDARTWLKLTKDNITSEKIRNIIKNPNSISVFVFLSYAYAKQLYKNTDSELITGVNWDDIKEQFNLTDDEVSCVFDEFIEAGLLYRTHEDGSLIKITEV